jgi:hypothetical protein
MALRSTIAALAVLCVSAVTAAAGGDPWVVAHSRLSYPLYKPAQTLGFKISSFGYQSCGVAKTKDSMYATYGTYRGVLLSKTRGFAVFEGSPNICSNPAGSTRHGTRVIGGVKADLGVYCDLPKQCSLAQGVQNGYILTWKRGATRIQMDSSHLTLAQLLQAASSLARVS